MSPQNLLSRLSTKLLAITIDISSAILVSSKFVCQAQFASMAYSFLKESRQWQNEDQRARSA